MSARSPGEYGEACLLPGDPLRAKYIAETYFDNPVQRNGERGMLGYSGEWEGKPVSVQSTGMGCPSAAIVMEELVAARRQALPARRHLRRAPAGPRARRPDRRGLGRPRRRDGDGTTSAASRTCRPPTGSSSTPPSTRAKELEQPLRVGAIASSDTFYDPDPERHKRWSARGVLGVEMEAAVLFTIGALRGVKAGCLLTVSDIVIGEEFTRISDDELRAAVDRMTRVALATVTGSH